MTILNNPLNITKPKQRKNWRASIALPKSNKRGSVANIGWKATAIPSGFVMLIDTREQKPLFANPPRGLVVVRTALKDGDYSIQGLESKVAIERKGVSDLVSYVGKERKTKTIPKLERFAQMDFAAIVVETSERKLAGKIPYTKFITKEHIRGFFKVCQVKYGIHVYCSASRADIERYVLDRLVYAYKQLQGG